MAVALVEDDAAITTRNRFRLRKPSEFAEFELRVDELRVFYRIVSDQVRVVLIGRKEGDQLIIEGKRIKL